MPIVHLLFAAAAVTFIAADAPGEAAPLVSEAATLAEGGRWAEIAPLVDRAPADPEAFLGAVIGIHNVLFDRERRTEAADVMRRAGARDPDLASHLEARVRALAAGPDQMARNAALVAYLGSGAPIEEVREIIAAVFPAHTRRKSAVEAFPASAGLTPPKLVHKVEPVFPAYLRRAHVGAKVDVFAFVSKNGGVRDAFVYKTTDSRFSDAALAAVRQWRYSPATIDGAPVIFPFTITVTFTVF